MKVTALSFTQGYYPRKNNHKVSNKKQTSTVPAFKDFGDRNLLLSFKGYYGDHQPLKKLFWISTNRNDIYEDNWTNDHIYSAGMVK